MILDTKADDELAFGRVYLSLIRQLVVRSQHMTDHLVRPHGLTGPQFSALLLIGNNEGLTQSDLVRLIESDANTVSSLVRRLAERELVVRTPHPDDRRAITLRLTDEGCRLAAAGLVDVDQLSRRLGRTVPRRHADLIANWLRTVIELEKLPADA